MQKGKLLINGTPVDRIKTNQLPNLVGYVVQAGGLFPHLTVEENIALVMRIAGYPSERISERVTEMLEWSIWTRTPTATNTPLSCPAGSSSAGSSPGLCGGPPHRSDG